MPERKLPMRQIKEVLRLHHEAHLSERQIARGCRISRSTVQRYLERAAIANLSWPLPESLDDTQLDRLLFPPAPATVTDEGHRQPKPQPDFTKVHHELKSNKNVTLQLLWQEFVEQHPNGAHYSWFCQQYREWTRHLDVVLRQEHRAGEKTFVDHAGDTIGVIDPATGQSRPAYVFVAVLGASSYTYAEATWTRSLPDWIGSHTRTLDFFGGATRLIVPDQWKAGVHKPCYWEPELNRTYQEWAIHNGVAIVPARPGRARDKAKVEQGVLVVQRWILAALRHRRFFSLAQLNEAIRELVHQLNQRPFRKLPGSRVELYEKLDRPALQPLPCQPYVFAEWKKERVRLDYHVELDGHHYSVPYQLVQQPVEIRYTVSTVEVIHRGKRVASHVRSQEAWHHDCGQPSAKVASAISRVDAGASVGVGGRDRAVHTAPGRGDADSQAASGSRLPHRDGLAPVSQPIRSRATGSCRHACGSLQTLPSRQHSFHPGDSARSTAVTATGDNGGAGCA